MLKYNNPRLSGAVVSGTGMDHPVRPHVIVGDTKMGYVRGDLMDANAIMQYISEIKGIIALLTGDDKLDSTINTLKEVENFLSGYKDTDTLLNEMNQVSDKMKEIESYSGRVNVGSYNKENKTLTVTEKTADGDNATSIDMGDVLNKDDVSPIKDEEIENILESN